MFVATIRRSRRLSEAVHNKFANHDVESHSYP